MPSKGWRLRVLRPACLVAELDRLLGAAVEQHVLHVRRQLGPRRLDVEAVVARERLDQLEVVIVAAVPAAHRAAGERQVRMQHDARRVEELLHAQAIAARAGAEGLLKEKSFGSSGGTL